MTYDEAKAHPHFKHVDGMVRAWQNNDEAWIAENVCAILQSEIDDEPFQRVLDAHFTPDHLILLDVTNPGLGRVQ